MYLFNIIKYFFTTSLSCQLILGNGWNAAVISHQVSPYQIMKMPGQAKHDDNRKFYA